MKQPVQPTHSIKTRVIAGEQGNYRCQLLDSSDDRLRVIAEQSVDKYDHVVEAVNNLIRKHVSPI